MKAILTAALSSLTVAACAHGGDLVLAERGLPATHAIVVAADAGESVQYAAQELQHYVEALTGVTLPVRTDSDGPAIRLERTDEHGEDGFRLVARPPDLLIRGGVRGCLYGVYELLETYGGVGWFASWRTVVPQLDRFVVPDTLDAEQRPAFAMRMTSWKDARNGDFAARLRLNGERAYLEARHGGAAYKFGGGLGNCHTFNYLLPPSKYFEQHPEYFAMRDGKRGFDAWTAEEAKDIQPCLTNPDVLRIMTSNVLAAIASDPTAGCYGVSQNDNRNYCQCPDCAAVDEEEGSHAGTIVRFVNAVAAEVERQFPHAIIETLAYQYSRKPPAKTRLRGNVMPCLCSIECDFHKPLDKSPYPNNVSFVADTRGWAHQTDMLYIWDYTTNFRNYLHAFPNILALQGNLRFFRENGAKCIYEQGDGLGQHADFAELRAWLLAKWLWNPDLPIEPLLDRFFTGYYGPAAKQARRCFDDLYSLPRDSVKQPLRISEDSMSPNIPTAFFERAEGYWQAAAEAAKDDPECSRNVKAASLSTDFSLFMRLCPRTVWAASRAPHDAERCRAYARHLLAAHEPFDLRLAEDINRDRMLWGDLAAVANNTGADARAEVSARRLSLSRPGVQGRFLQDDDTLDGMAIKLFTHHCVWCVQLPMSKVAFDSGATYKVRARIKVEKTDGARGEAFYAGVYDERAKKSCGMVSVKAEDCGDGYAWYDVCTWEPRDGQYFWLGPGRTPEGATPTANAIWVDRIEIALVPL